MMTRLPSGENRDQRLAGARAGVVQRLDEHLLAGAGLALDQDRDVLLHQPLGLAHGVKLRRGVAAGAVVRWSDADVDESSTAVKARREMEAAAQ